MIGPSSAIAPVLGLSGQNSLEIRRTHHTSASSVPYSCQRDTTRAVGLTRAMQTSVMTFTKLLFPVWARAWRTINSASQAPQVTACSMSLRIVDAKLRLMNPRIEFSVVSEMIPETDPERSSGNAIAKLNTWKNFMMY